MFFFKKKEKEKSKLKSNQEINGKILFKKKYNEPKIKEREKLKKINKGYTIKPKKKKKNPRFEKIQKDKKIKLTIRIIIAIITITVIILIFYFIILFVGNIRGGTTTKDISNEQNFVEGFKDVPIFPNSEFIYEKTKEEPIVQTMLSKGISAYRFPRGIRTNEIYEYYEHKLEEYEWKYILTQTTNSDEKLFGQYWYKKNKGLRIYIVNNDIWYEKISMEEAKNALKERREQEIKRANIFKSSEEQLLLPHYPWDLKIPSEYIIKYSESDVEDLEKIVIQKDNLKYFIEPLEKDIGDNFDDYLEQLKDNKDWEITQRQNRVINKRESYYFHYKTKTEIGEGYLIQNNINYLIYAVFTNTIDDDFFEYVMYNIIEP